MTAMLIAYGANNFCVPCLVFPDLKVGEHECDKIFIDDEDVKKSRTPNGEIRYKTVKDQVSGEIIDKLFSIYDNSNNDAYLFILKEVEYGKPFANWITD